MLIQGKLLSAKDNLKDVFEIRREVFVKELGISEQMEFDEKDRFAIHAIAYLEENHTIPVATGRLYFDGDTCYLEKLAVLKEYRNRQYGEFILRMLLNKADMAGIQKVYVKGNKPFIDYFKGFGFLPDNNIKEKDAKTLSIQPKNLFLGCKH